MQAPPTQPGSCKTCGPGEARPYTEGGKRPRLLQFNSYWQGCLADWYLPWIGCCCCIGRWEDGKAREGSGLRVMSPRPRCLISPLLACRPAARRADQVGRQAGQLPQGPPTLAAGGVCSCTDEDVRLASDLPQRLTSHWLRRHGTQARAHMQRRCLLAQPGGASPARCLPWPKRKSRFSLGKEWPGCCSISKGSDSFPLAAGRQAMATGWVRLFQRALPSLLHVVVLVAGCPAAATALRCAACTDCEARRASAIQQKTTDQGARSSASGPRRLQPSGWWAVGGVPSVCTKAACEINLTTPAVSTFPNLVHLFPSRDSSLCTCTTRCALRVDAASAGPSLPTRSASALNPPPKPSTASRNKQNRPACLRCLRAASNAAQCS